jgi:glyoxylase I family protein
MLGVHHLAVLVSDLDRAETFYCNVLGLPLKQRWTDDHGRPRSFWVHLTHGTFLAIERSDARPKEADRGWHCVALGIEPAERSTWREKLKAAGITLERESDFTMYFRDPDGNLLGLSHYPAAKQG